jgi:hypothetical protein
VNSVEAGGAAAAQGVAVGMWLESAGGERLHHPLDLDRVASSAFRAGATIPLAFKVGDNREAASGDGAQTSGSRREKGSVQERGLGPRSASACSHISLGRALVVGSSVRRVR